MSYTLQILLFGYLLLSTSTLHIFKVPTNKSLELQLHLLNNAKTDEYNKCLYVKVYIINHTDTAVSFFEDWNSWGYFNLHFEIKIKDSSYSMYKYERGWDKNFPSFRTLFPGDSMHFTYNLHYDKCMSSTFSGVIPLTNNITTIKAIYQLDNELLESARLTGEIKYKKIAKYSTNKNRGSEPDWAIVDSLKKPVEVNRSFPLTKLESNALKLH